MSSSFKATDSRSNREVEQERQDVSLEKKVLSYLRSEDFFNSREGFPLSAIITHTGLTYTQVKNALHRLKALGQITSLHSYSCKMTFYRPRF
jgi:DNA-binding MarR family transcriptional regulator